MEVSVDIHSIGVCSLDFIWHIGLYSSLMQFSLYSVFAIQERMKWHLKKITFKYLKFDILIKMITNPTLSSSCISESV